MKKRTLFVFAGQSNMMGAAALPAKSKILLKNSYEYLHNPKRMGEASGAFTARGFPVGEFSYCDMEKAYSNCDEMGKVY